MALHLSSQDGRFFIRETSYLLRVVRQRSEDDGAIPREDLLPENSASKGYAKANGLHVTLSGWQNESWFYVGSGPDKERFNCIGRVSPGSASYGLQPVLGDLTYVFHGDSRVWDDGELLVASRTTRSQHERQLVREKIRENLPGSIPPRIDASDWLNSDELAWSELEGKVVLLDFWATWCAPCMKKLPDVQKLADKYADQGFIVIAIHSATGAETCEDAVKTLGLKFPVAVDTGATAEKYAIGAVPSYFLIDRSGHVVDGYTADLPSGETIRKLLEAGRDNDQTVQEQKD